MTTLILEQANFDPREGGVSTPGLQILEEFARVCLRRRFLQGSSRAFSRSFATALNYPGVRLCREVSMACALRLPEGPQVSMSLAAVATVQNELASLRREVAKLRDCEKQQSPGCRSSQDVDPELCPRQELLSRALLIPDVEPRRKERSDTRRIIPQAEVCPASWLTATIERLDS